MSQTARHVTHLAWTAAVPARGAAQCVPHSRSCLKMAAACPAVEMRHTMTTNQYPGSAVTARPHKVNTNLPTKHTQIQTVLSLVPGI